MAGWPGIPEDEDQVPDVYGIDHEEDDLCHKGNRTGDAQIPCTLVLQVLITLFSPGSFL